MEFSITKCDTVYYKLRQALQSAMNLLQIAAGITKCDDYYKLRQYTEWGNPSSETHGQSVGSGERAWRKFSSTGQRAHGYRLSPNYFQKFKRIPAPDWAQKCFVLLYPIGEQFLLSSFREFVHDGYCFNHGLSGSCTKGMHVVRKLSVWYKIPMWFQKTVCPKAKDAFPKTEQVFTLASVTSSDVLRKY